MNNLSKAARTGGRSLWRISLVAVVVLSLSINAGLAVVNFVLQPIWRNAAVASAVAATSVKEEAEQKRAMAAERAEAEARERKAVAAERARMEARLRKTIAEERAQAEVRERQAVAAVRTRMTAQLRTAVAAEQAEARVRERQAAAQAKVRRQTAVYKERAKGRVRRMAVAVPVIGALSAAGFEYWNYSEWQKDNPDGDVQTYAEETLETTKLVLEEVLSELPEAIRPDPDEFIAQYEQFLDSLSASSESSWQWPELPEVPSMPEGWNGWEIPFWGEEEASSEGS